MHRPLDRPRDARGVRCFRDFLRAWRKARQWHCDLLPSAIVATRFALTGDSGLFQGHHGWSCVRIHRGQHPR